MLSMFYVVIVFHLVKQSAKPLGFLFSIFVKIGPHGSDNFFQQITPENFKAASELYPSGPHKSTVLDFKILRK